MLPVAEPGAASSSASAPSSAASNATAVVAFDLWPLPDVSLPHEVLLLLRQFLPTEHFAHVHSACVYENESWGEMIRDVASLEEQFVPGALLAFAD